MTNYNQPPVPEYQPYGGSGRAPLKPHRGSTILVLGILSLVVFAPLGIAAWIMGNSDLKEIDAGYMDPTGRGQVQAGRVCGMIATILMVIGVVVACLAFVLIFGLLGVGVAAAGAAHP